MLNFKYRVAHTLTIQLWTIGMTAATPPTTIPWSWTRLRLATAASEKSESRPRLACVESLEASVISRLPFNPSRAGTRMNSSGNFRKALKCRRLSNRTPANTIPTHREKGTILKENSAKKRIS